MAHRFRRRRAIGEEGQPLQLTKSGMEGLSCRWEVGGEEVEEGNEERQRVRAREDGGGVVVGNNEARLSF